MASQATKEYFHPSYGINQEVMMSDFHRYLGRDALVRPGNHEEPTSGKLQQGFFVTARLPLTSNHIANLRADSECWEAEKGAAAARGEISNFYYRNSATRKSRLCSKPTVPASPSQNLPARNHRPYGPYSSYSRYNPYGRYYEGGYYSKRRDPCRNLPIVQHVKPNRKDLPLLLKGIPCRACADFGASANVIDSKFARELDLTIDFITPCPAFELPTFRKLLKPSGRVSMTCEFPEELASRIVEDFFVIENFVHSVVMGRIFLRKTELLIIVASLGGQDESLRFWLDGQELLSTPDTGSEINVMSLLFAQKRGFVIKEDPVHQVRFADSSLQNVEGVVSVPVSFGNGAPPELLLKLVEPDQRNYSAPIVRTGNVIDETDRRIEYGSTASILADFHILDGLKVDIIFGEDILATVNAFVRHSTDFDETASSLSESPSLATMGLVKKTGKLFCSVLGKQQSQSKMIDLERERDIADSKELDRYEKEKNDMGKLVGDEKARAERRNEQKRREYTEN